jgi:monoamine oxidase
MARFPACGQANNLYRYHPRAIASWPVGRSRFDPLSDELRTSQGRIYFAGDFTKDTHSNGAIHSALRVVKGILQQY